MPVVVLSLLCMMLLVCCNAEVFFEEVQDIGDQDKWLSNTTPRYVHLSVIVKMSMFS